MPFVFSVGDRAKVTSPTPAHEVYRDREGAVTAVGFAGQTNSIPPTGIGETDFVSIPGERGPVPFDVTELTKV